MTRPRVAAVLLAVAICGWTWVLLAPNPVPAPVKAWLGFWDWAAFLVAKGLHLGVYAGLAALAAVATRDAGPRAGWLAAGCLLLHGAATEVGQTYVPNRGGSGRDVAIDWAGVAAGTLAARRVRR